ncbi:hypothetical protein BDV12DRAFT_167083 [Aspergillus spectabilis]
MSYTITVTIVNDAADDLSVVEKTCWHYANGGTWKEHNGREILTMGSSGTSGILRFQSPSGELSTVVVGIHNWQPWCDAQVDLATNDTGVKLHPEYYSGGRLSGEAHREIQRTSSKGTHVKVFFDAVEGHQISAVVQYF